MIKQIFTTTKHTLTLCLFCWALSAGLVAQTTVSILPGYTHRAYYSLDQGLVKQSLDTEWDLTFQLTGFAAGIRAHHSKGVTVRQVPGLGIAAWEQVDTTGMAAWPLLVNDPTRWDIGALNRGLNPGNPFDLGWGVYNPITHHVNGDSLFVITLEDGQVRKLKIDRLASGVFTFTHAQPDGSDEVVVELRKSDFPDRHFAYYSFASDSLLDLDPPVNSWDLVFSRYQGSLGPGLFYPVTGVRSNFGVRTAELRGVDVTAVQAADTSLFPLSSDIDVIGFDWKSFNMTTFQWELADSLAYLVQQPDGDVHKLVFTGFGGSATGDFVFDQGGFTTSLFASRPAPGGLQAYPNPAQSVMQLSWTLPQAERLQVYDLTGRLLEEVALAPGAQTHRLDRATLPAGTYLLRLTAARGYAVQRVQFQ